MIIGKPLKIRKPILHSWKNIPPCDPKLAEEAIKRIMEKCEIRNKERLNENSVLKKKRCRNIDPSLKPRKDYPDKFCKKCSTFQKYSYFSRHTKICKGRDKKNKYEEEKYLLFKQNEALMYEVKRLQTENEQLKMMLSKRKKKIPDITINEYVSDKTNNTQASYLSVWNKYEKWCSENRMLISDENSCIKYYKSLFEMSTEKKYKISTKNTIRRILIIAFKGLYKNDISLHMKTQRNVKVDTEKVLYEQLRDSAIPIKI